jgi:hypothetical protein
VFDDVMTRDYGGNILMRALSQPFFAHFDPEQSEHRQAIARLIAFDEEESRRRPSHHAFFIARKADASGAVRELDQVR